MVNLLQLSLLVLPLALFTTGDSYRWKYMYTIPVASVLKFFSNDYMPVFTNDAVKTNAVAGEIDTVVINSAGAGL